MPVSTKHPCTGAGFESHYKQLTSSHYFVKFDDDIMYIKDKAIDAMLHAKLMNQFWIVSANVINHSSKFFPVTLCYRWEDYMTAACNVSRCSVDMGTCGNGGSEYT